MEKLFTEKIIVVMHMHSICKCMCIEPLTHPSRQRVIMRFSPSPHGCCKRWRRCLQWLHSELLSATLAHCRRESKSNAKTISCTRNSWGQPEGPHRGWGIENNFCSVQPVGQPVQRMVAPVANVDGDTSKLGLKHLVAKVPFHVVCGLCGR